MSLEVSSEVIAALQRAAAAAHPDEACGLLLGEGEAIRLSVETRNVHAAPRSHFEIDPQALIKAHKTQREGGPRLIGYFHSHPSGDGEPSQTDRAMAPGDGKVWAIIAEKRVFFWRDNKDGFEALSYHIASR